MTDTRTADKREMPKRIQRMRTAGWRMPENTIYVGRPSKWGNPWKPGQCIGADYHGPRHGPVSIARWVKWHVSQWFYRWHSRLEFEALYGRKWDNERDLPF